MGLTIYIIDTSSLVTLHRWRPLSSNREIWDNLEKLIRDDRLIAPEEVYDEIRAGDDALARWASRKKQQRRLFRPTTRQHAGIAKQIIHEFPDFVERDRPTPQADPFVVALAVHEGRSVVAAAEERIVVTDEKFTPTGRPRIPHVCAAHGVRYLSIHQMYVNEGWTI